MNIAFENLEDLLLGVSARLQVLGSSITTLASETGSSSLDELGVAVSQEADRLAELRKLLGRVAVVQK